jgi:hypothetical protein
MRTFRMKLRLMELTYKYKHCTLNNLRMVYSLGGHHTATITSGYDT